MTEAVIRRAEDADLAAIVRLRREWTQEQEGDRGDPTFDERLAAWFARESSRRITWLAEVDGRPVGMMNLAIFERMEAHASLLSWHPPLLISMLALRGRPTRVFCPDWPLSAMRPGGA
jgi:hypothetical protein